jgi:hypothetical protein
MNIDPAIAYSLAAATVGIVSTLWLQVRSQVRDLRADLKAAVSRLRTLEDARADLLRSHAADYRDIAHQVTTAMAERSATNRQILSALRARPCLIDSHHPDLPACGTDRHGAHIHG